MPENTCAFQVIHLAVQRVRVHVCVCVCVCTISPRRAACACTCVCVCVCVYVCVQYHLAMQLARVELVEELHQDEHTEDDGVVLVRHPLLRVLLRAIVNRAPSLLEAPGKNKF
jgi:hypothetical protein